MGEAFRMLFDVNQVYSPMLKQSKRSYLMAFLGLDGIVIGCLGCEPLCPTGRSMVSRLRQTKCWCIGSAMGSR